MAVELCISTLQGCFHDNRKSVWWCFRRKATDTRRDRIGRLKRFLSRVDLDPGCLPLSRYPNIPGLGVLLKIFHLWRYIGSCKSGDFQASLVFLCCVVSIILANPLAYFPPAIGSTQWQQSSAFLVILHGIVWGSRLPACYITYLVSTSVLRK